MFVYKHTNIKYIKIQNGKNILPIENKCLEEGQSKAIWGQ